MILYFLGVFGMFFTEQGLANTDYSLETKHYVQDKTKTVRSKGHFISPMASDASYQILKKPSLYKDVSNYVLSFTELKDHTVSYKVCFLFVCREPVLKFRWSKQTVVWEIQKGRYKGSHGKYEVLNSAKAPSKVLFESEVNYSNSILPQWLIRYAVKKSGETLIEETMSYLRKIDKSTRAEPARTKESQ